MALATREDPRSVAEQPYAWVLWVFWNLDLIERQDAARRAIEREELVYGIAHAYHGPGQLDRWRYDLRRNVGLLEKPESALQRAERIVRTLQDTKEWGLLDDGVTTEGG